MFEPWTLAHGRSTSPELLLQPLVVSRNESERVLIEPSVNSIRLSIAIKQADEIEKILCHKWVSNWPVWAVLDRFQRMCRQLRYTTNARRFTRFMMMRAEGFVILRRKPLPVSSSRTPRPSGGVVGNTTGLTVSGLRHIILDNEFPRGIDAQAQACRLHYPVHGGCRQGDIRDEIIIEC